MTKLELLENRFERNKRHSPRIHGNKTLEETGLMVRCYRCYLLIEIEKEKKRVMPPLKLVTRTILRKSAYQTV